MHLRLTEHPDNITKITERTMASETHALAGISTLSQDQIT